MRAFGKVGAAGNEADTVKRIIDDNRQMIGGADITSRQNHIAMRRHIDWLVLPGPSFGGKVLPAQITDKVEGAVSP